MLYTYVLFYYLNYNPSLSRVGYIIWLHYYNILFPRVEDLLSYRITDVVKPPVYKVVIIIINITYI